MSRKSQPKQQFYVLKVIKTAAGWNKQVPYCSDTTARSALGRISLAQNGTYILASKLGGEMIIKPRKAYAMYNRMAA
jgi:hypothetical protein